MFSYLRYFFGISLFVILIGAVLFGWNYRNTSINIIMKQVEQKNVLLSKNFKNTVWLQYSAMMKTHFYEMQATERTKYQEFNTMSNKTRDLIQDTNVVLINIYKDNGSILYSSTPNKGLVTGVDPSSAITGYDNIKMSPQLTLTDGEVKSEIISKAKFHNTDGAETKGSLIRTLIPLGFESTGKAEIALEIFSDISSDVNTLNKWQYIGAGFVFLLLVLMYVILTFTSHRAEKIIEKQHETNLELAGAKATAENQNAQKSQFLASISHELRTPLNAIIGFSEIIKDEVMGELNNEQYKNYIKDIHSSGVHLLSLINDILDYSKAEAGKLEIEFEDIDLTKLISSSLRLQEPRANSSSVQLLAELPNEHIIIRSDSKRIKQILLNVLSNAVKFTQAGGSVKISAWRNMQDHSRMIIEVRDTGIGIAPKDIAKALSPFGQVDSELSRRYEGTGLGLPLTKKFVELLGGDLKLDSELGKGTTITISLPVNADPNGLTPQQHPVKAAS